MSSTKSRGSINTSPSGFGLKPRRSEVMGHSATNFAHSKQLQKNILTKPVTNPVRMISRNHSCIFAKQDLSTAEGMEIDVRDQRVRLGFEKEKVESLTTLGEDLKASVTQWLVRMNELVTSVGFNHLASGKLNEQEAKNFSAKNILLNIKEFVQNLRNFDFTDKVRLMDHINTEQRAAIAELLHKYPQTGGRGASQRLRKHLEKIDNRNSNQFDFLPQPGIAFRYRQDEDYSSEIMRLLNRLITFSSDSYANNLDATNFEKFQEVLELLFTHSATRNQEELIKKAASLFVVQNELPREVAFLLVDNFAEDDFLECLRDSGGKEKEGEQKGKRMLIDKIDGELLVSQKIPSQTVPFSAQEVEIGRFRAQNAAVLRIVTKWAEQLSERLQKGQQITKYRQHKFKTTNQGEVVLEQEQLRAIEEAARKQWGRVSKYLRHLDQQKLKLQVRFAEEIIEGKHTIADTNLGIFAAKLREITAQYMFRYLNRLIHALLAVPRRASEIYLKGRQEEDWLKQCARQSKAKQLESLDLLTFKVGDILRARASCSEGRLVRLLAALKGLSQNGSGPGLRIVRVKNRLDQKDNDVLLNLFFAGKIQVQLQLSVISACDRKTKQYSSFNHFLYELQRAVFGPVSELACIIGDHDPLIKRFARDSAFSPAVTSTLANFSQPPPPEVYMRSGNLPFVCAGCGRLKQLFNPYFYEREGTSLGGSAGWNQCNQCYARGLQATHQLAFVRSLLSHICNEGSADYKFYNDHLYLWKIDLQELGKRKWQYLQNRLPERGIIIQKDRKRPTLKLFQRFIEDGTIYLVHQDKETKAITILLTIQGDQESIQKLPSKINRFFLFGFRNRSNRQQKDFALVTDLRELRDYEWQEKEVACNMEGCQCAFKVELPLNREVFRKYINKQFLEVCIRQAKPVLLLKGRRISSEIEEYLAQPQRKTNYLKALKVMDISFNNLPHLSFLRAFTGLIELNLQNSEHLTSLQGIQSCLELRHLQITRSQICSLQELRPLTRLETLKLNQNDKLTRLIGLEGCLSLQSLELSEAKVESLQPIAGCKSLLKLVVSAPKIVTFAELRGLVRLQVLHALNCLKLECITGIEALSELRELVIVGACQLGKLRSLNSCKRLQKFSCCHSSVDSLDGLSSPCLLEINIDQCYSLRCLDFNEEQLTSLTTLRIYDCKKLEDLGGLQLLTSLRTFICGNNGSIKEAQFRKIGGLIGLQHLNLSNSIGNSPLHGLKYLSFLKQCFNLRILKCSENALPEQQYRNISFCHQLRCLHLNNNKNLHSLHFIAGLKLQRLDIGNNSKLKQFETHLADQKNLFELNIENLKVKEDYSLVFWQHWKHLETLNIRNCNIRLNGLQQFSELEKLMLGCEQPALRDRLQKFLTPERLANIEVLFQAKPKSDKIIENKENVEGRSLAGHIRTLIKTGKKGVNGRRNSREKTIKMSSKYLL